MHKVADWTSQHSTTSSEVQDILQAWFANALMSVPPHWPWSSETTDPEIDQASFLDDKIKPALARCLGLDDALDNVRILPLSKSREKYPHACFSERERNAVIYLDWTGTPADALCLAHEMGHAAHYIAGCSSDMPPIARETCAFVAELVVLDELLKSNDALFRPLQLMWERENDVYLGSDIEGLQKALGDPDATYMYRWNYPLARLGAVEIFQAFKSGEVCLTDLFKSGGDGMSFLPMAQMAAKADQIHNHLPPFRAAEEPEMAAYQALGAMTLLDIDTFEGPSEQAIGDVYAEMLKNLQKQSAFLGLRQDERPIGYATWDSMPEGDGLTITHQSAPFGDHLKLLRTLQRRFSDVGAVLAISQRSARKEQLAW